MSPRTAIDRSSLARASGVVVSSLVVLSLVVLSLVVLASACWPLRDALLSGAVPGAGPDIVSTLWGNWWFSQVGPVDAAGAWTPLVNYPAGAVGALLSPVTAGLWTVTQPFLGAGGASSFTVILQVAGLAGLTALLARRAGATLWGVTVAALTIALTRTLPYGAGEGSAVAIAALPLPLGLCLLLGSADSSKRWVDAAFLAVCMPALALENRYLTPVLPAATLLVFAWRSRTAAGWRPPWHLLAALVLGVGGVVAVMAIFGRAAAVDYPVETFGQTWSLAGVPLRVVDLPWARLRPLDLVWPAPVEWTLDVDTARHHAGGGHYLGLVAVALAGLGLVLRPGRVAPWMGLALVGASLSLGSLIGSVGGPFLYLNAFLDAVARPFTQPTRYLVVALVGVAVSAGLAVDALRLRFGRGLPILAIALLLVDGWSFGGPSLRLPTTTLPVLSCADQLPPGAVLTWPTDALPDWPASSQLLQLVHGHASPHRGIASWRLEQPLARVQVHDLGWDRHTKVGIDAAGLVAAGFRPVLVEADSSPDERAWLQASLGPPVVACDGVVVHDLSLATGVRSASPRGDFSPPSMLPADPNLVQR